MTRPSSLLDHLDDGLAAFESDFRCTYANTAAALACGIGLERLVGQRLFDAAPALRDADVLREAMATRAERRVDGHDAGGQPVDLRATPLPDGGLLVQWRSQQAVHDALAQQQRRHDDFLALLSHDLRNPLSPLHTSLELMARPNIPPDAKERARAIMGRQVAQLVRLIDELVEVARVGDAPAQPEPVMLASVIEHALQLSQPALAAKEQSVQQRPDADVPRALHVDPKRLAQAVAALLRDASRRVERGEAVLLRVGTDAAGALVAAVRAGGDDFQSFAPAAVDAPLPQRLSVGLTLVSRLAQKLGGRLLSPLGADPALASEFAIRLPPGTWETR